MNGLNCELGYEAFGFCVDISICNIYYREIETQFREMGIDFENFIVTLGGRLKVLHIYDNDGTGDLHQILFTFTRSRENTASTDWEFCKGTKKNTLQRCS